MKEKRFTIYRHLKNFQSLISSETDGGSFLLDADGDKIKFISYNSAFNYARKLRNTPKYQTFSIIEDGGIYDSMCYHNEFAILQYRVSGDCVGYIVDSNNVIARFSRFNLALSYAAKHCLNGFSIIGHGPTGEYKAASYQYFGIVLP